MVRANAPVSLSLETLLKNALERNGQIKESMQDVEVAKSQLDQANAARYPKGTATFIAAPIFEETGNAVQSYSNWNKWGPFLQGGIQVVQPIYTFGQIGGYRDAATHQVLAKSGLADVRRNEVVYTTKEYYYSYLMATDLENLVDKLVEFLEEAVNTAEDDGQKKKSSVKPHDIFRLKTALEDLRQKKLQAKAGRMTAEKAIAWMSATEYESLRGQPLEPEAFEIKPIEEYLKLAKANRPEFRALKEGQEARAALRDAKQAQSYPVLFVGGFASAGWSPVREKQHSVFAMDPFNQPQGGFGVGLRLDLEFARHSAEASEQDAELLKLKATESYAAPGIELQVKRAFWDLEQAVQSLKIAERRKQQTKKWFVGSAMGWSIGLTPPKELLESLEGDGTAKKNYIETVFAHNMALAKLTQAVGVEVTKLKYR